MEELIDVGQPKWVLAKGTDIMHFKADEWHNEVRLEFAIKIPFAAVFYINLRKDEAKVLSTQLLDASNKCKDNKGEDGE